MNASRLLATSLAASLATRVGRVTVTACLLIVAATWGGLLHQSRLDRAEAIAQAENENGFIASAFEEHVRRILRTSDSALRYVVHELETRGEVTESLRGYCELAVADLSAIQLSIADAQGKLVHLTVPGRGPVNIADREHFQVHARSADVGLHVGRPVVTRSTGAWSFFLSRRINRRDGTFGGVASLGLDPFHFGRVYGDLRIGQDRVGLLVGTDHLVRVRISRDDRSVGDDISAFSPVFRLAAERPAGHYDVVTASRQARFSSYRAMPDFPLIVIVSALQEEVLARWREGLRRDVAVAAVFSALVLAFGALLLRAQALHRRREAEAQRLQERLVHGQKLEAIGTLAGGVAHDFNNMLGVILGQVEFAKEEAGQSGPLRESLDEIEQAAKRSVEVTRQLLAFARRQPVAPRVIDLDASVEPILGILRRLIGERIELRWAPGAGRRRVRIDPSQLDQLLTNLSTNARDAIDGDGRVTIATSDARVDLAWSARVPGAAPGDYAVLTVADTGAGIPAEDLPNIFEPFFTRKARGKGTGLGLATVYGIVRQNGGFIEVESAPPTGTTFRLYLPRASGEGRVDEEPHAPRDAPRGGSESILVVEDEPAKLELVRKMLASLGYRVVAFGDPAEALRMAEAGGPTFDLLVTDVVMPRMNGRELYEALARLRPGLRCLYMSGYPADVIVNQGTLEPGLHYLQKPFTKAVLAEKVREVLEGR